MNSKFTEELTLHQKWLAGEPDGKQADFSSENLRGVDFSNCDLRKAIFDYSDLSEANLSGAQLQYASLHNAVMYGVLVNSTWFNGADLSYTFMCNVHFYKTDINGINAKGINWSQSDLAEMRITNLDLSESIMFDTNLRHVILRNCTVNGADIVRANMYSSQIINCKFTCCDLRDTNFMKTSFMKSDFKYCKLQGANFGRSYATDCTFEDVDFDHATTGFSSVCPEEGSFIGYIKADKYIVVLEIPDDAERVSNTTHRCSATKAKVIRIENLDGTQSNKTSVMGYKQMYTVGETIVAKHFCNDRWLQLNMGITFYMSRQLAEQCPCE